MPLLPGMGSAPLTARVGRAASRGALLAGLLLLTAASEQNGPFVIDGQRVPPAAPRRFAAFRNARLAAVTYLAWAKPRPRGVHHFCVVAYDLGKDDHGFRDLTAMVHWVEGRRVIMWEPQHSSRPGQDTALVLSRRDWDLDRDVQDHPDPDRITDWIVERSWIDAILADCARVGERLTVTMPPPGSREARRRAWKPSDLPDTP